MTPILRSKISRHEPTSALDLALDFAERIHGVGLISVARFFGGAALKANGVQFGFVMKGSLYLKMDGEGRALSKHWAHCHSSIQAVGKR